MVMNVYTINGASDTQPWGLDNTFPYPFARIVNTNPPSPFIPWASADGTSQFEMNDNPSIEITGLNSYGRAFAAKCFVAFHPPVASGESFETVPVLLQPWTYDTSSDRSDGVRW